MTESRPVDPLREMASRLGTTLTFDGPSSSSSSDCASQPTKKTRLDLLLAKSCAVPSLSFLPPPSRAPNAADRARNQPAGDKGSLERLASSSLGRLVRYDGDAVRDAPNDMARSLASSFAALADCNLRGFARLHARERPEVVGAIASSFRDGNKLVRVQKLETTFLPSSAGGRREEDGTVRVPLTARFALDVVAHGAVETVVIETAGAIHGRTVTPRASDDDAIDDEDEIELRLSDAPALLLSLRQEARLAAYRAVTALVIGSGGAAMPPPPPRSPAAGRGGGRVSASSSARLHPSLAASADPKKRRLVTPCSSPSLASLVEAAAALEPVADLSRQHPTAAAAAPTAAGAAALPPKKRMRTTSVVSPVHRRSPVPSVGAPLLTGLGVLSGASA